jgi:hypothetical protein
MEGSEMSPIEKFVALVISVALVIFFFMEIAKVVGS